MDGSGCQRWGRCLKTVKLCDFYTANFQFPRYLRGLKFANEHSYSLYGL